MYLKSLELAGFKSFAKKTTLDFTSPITAIVGPNGSGKSNIAEAFRFVLGEQSIKSMRGKRTEDLIWNGSPELVRSNRASVKLFFDNRRKLFSIDFDEVGLERIIYRDASSEYLLNGSQVRLRDIVETLSGAHIGASGHHIISQGEADRILNANMKERREMIEDALGLKIYQWRREESERKLERTEENMKQVEGLRKEIAPHIAFLKKQVEKIERVKGLKEELRVLYGEYLSREHSYIFDSKETISREEQDPRRELEKLAGELFAAKKILEETRGKDAQTREIIALEEKLHELRKERETLSREEGRLEGEIAAAERLSRASATAEGAERAVPLSEIEKILKDSEEIFSPVDSGAITRIFEKIKTALQKIVQKYRAQKNPAMERVESSIISLTARKKEVEGKLAEMREAEQKMSEQEKRLRASVEKEKDSSRDAEKEMFRIMAKQNELHGALATLTARRREIEHLEADFKRELTEGALLVGREILEYEKKETLYQFEADRTSQEERRRKIEKLKIRIEDAGAGGGAEVLKEFEEVGERDRFLARELGDLAASAETLRTLILELEQKLDEEFRGGIEKINDEFQKFFELMFGGGRASLSVFKKERRARGARAEEENLLDETELAAALIAPEQETEEGIDITVSLPRKKIKGLMMLSGGERALTSIALLFAMSQVKPPPFIILDETDAALDEANSKKYGDMVENLSKHSQLILITHNRETMSRAGVIYGVTMDRSGVSKLLSIAFDEAEAVAK